jgi:hypothetical protein
MHAAGRFYQGDTRHESHMLAGNGGMRTPSNSQDPSRSGAGKTGDTSRILMLSLIERPASHLRNICSSQMRTQTEGMDSPE